MPAIHLAHAVGGDLMKGFIAAVAFATILAVVSGLTLSGVAARPLRRWPVTSTLANGSGSAGNGTAGAASARAICARTSSFHRSL